MIIERWGVGNGRGEERGGGWKGGGRVWAETERGKRVVARLCVCASVSE